MCMNPLAVHWDDYRGQYCFGGSTSRSRTRFDHLKREYKPIGNKNSLIVPCGRCPECRAKWRTQLAQRVRWELEKYKHNCCFITLTVNDYCIDEVFPNRSLQHDYFQLFMKRLRRHLEYHGFKGKIKYLMCGEYGENENHRPHFHAILFGWKPEDLRYDGKSKKGYTQYVSELLQRLWKKVGVTQKEIDRFNNDPRNINIVRRNGGDFDYLPLGFVKVSTDVREDTAPYMVKYILKYSEIKKDEFELNGEAVRKPYVVYPKCILGLDYFLEHIEQIMANGFILNSKGTYVGIPRSFIKFLENSEDLELQNYLILHKFRCMEFIEERRKILEVMGYKTFCEQFEYEREQGRVRREMYEAMKNNNR